MPALAAVNSERALDARGPELNYVPSLDGVRAVAVVVIMGYHGGLFLANGGFYSLDTFFTLSGFLITTLLVAEWQQAGAIRLVRFWARRPRPLLPALFLLVLAVVAYVALFSTPGTYGGLRLDAFSTLFYVANWHFILVGSNYFAQTGPTSPLLHTWSLAVEEQFYLFWPLVVIAVLRTRFGLRLLLVVCVLGALASATLMGVLYSPAAQNRVYYGTDTRAQSLLLGAALSVSLTLLAKRRGPTGVLTSTPSAWRAGTVPTRRALIAVGIVGAGVSAALWTLVSVNDAFAFRGGFLLASASTACVLASVVVAPGSVLTAVLTIRPLRYLGRISYGMYLWHFPLFLWITHANTNLDDVPLFALRFVCTVLVASASFYLVEQPIRQRRFLRSSKTVLAAAPASILAVVVVVVAATPLTVTAAQGAFRPPARQVGPLYTGPPVKLLLVGDSTAATLGIGLGAYRHAYNIEMQNSGILGCGVTEGAEYELQGVVAPMASACNGTSGQE